MSAFALPGESRPSNIRVKIKEKNLDKFHLSWSVGQFITRFDCHAAVCLPDEV